MRSSIIIIIIMPDLRAIIRLNAASLCCPDNRRDYLIMCYTRCDTATRAKWFVTVCSIVRLLLFYSRLTNRNPYCLTSFRRVAVKNYVWPAKLMCYPCLLRMKIVPNCVTIVFRKNVNTI